MDHLLNLMEQNGKTVVSARELYTFLEVKSDFTEWSKRMFEYGFEENKDFTPILGKSTGGRPSKDYALTVECGKEISMLQRSEKGKQARLYFIECEKKLMGRKEVKPVSTADFLLQTAMAIKEQEQRTTLLENKVQLLEAKTTTIPDYFTVVGYAMLRGIKNIGVKTASKVGCKAKAICRQNDIRVESTPDPRFGKVGMYPTHILEEAFSSLKLT